MWMCSMAVSTTEEALDVLIGEDFDSVDESEIEEIHHSLCPDQATRNLILILSSMMKHHSLHHDQVTSQTRIPTLNLDPADQEVAHPKERARKGEGEEEEAEGEGEGEGEGGEEVVKQEAEVV